MKLLVRFILIALVSLIVYLMTHKPRTYFVKVVKKEETDLLMEQPSRLATMRPPVINNNLNMEQTYIISQTEPTNRDLVQLRSFKSVFDLKPKESELRYMDEKTADMVHQVSLQNDDWILSPPLCEDDTYLLIIMISATPNFQRRAEARDALQFMPHRGKNVRLAFITALADDLANAKVRNESREYNDIIQSNHIDAYRNLTYKAMGCLKWMLTKCRSAKFFQKIDDDVIVFYQNVVDYAMSLEASNTTFVYAGGNYAYLGLGVFRTGKWGIPRDIYKNDTYPLYISGFAVLFSRDAAREIYRASFHVQRAYDIPVRRSFPVDDSFIGICAKYAGIKNTRSRWTCLQWIHVKESLEKDRCYLANIMVVLNKLGYKAMDIYLKQLQNMTANEIDVCRKKELKRC
jgi:hypothetical protein